MTIFNTSNGPLRSPPKILQKLVAGRLQSLQAQFTNNLRRERIGLHQDSGGSCRNSRALKDWSDLKRFIRLSQLRLFVSLAPA